MASVGRHRKPVKRSRLWIFLHIAIIVIVALSTISEWTSALANLISEINELVKLFNDDATGEANLGTSL